MSTAAQIKRIHTLKTRAGLKEHEYRSLVLVYGGQSSKDLDDAAAARLIANLDTLAGGGTRSPATRATGKFAGKLQSLWISGHNLGVIRDRSDRAMLAYVKGQTGVEHTRFLNDPAIALPAIEGLKGWIARDGGVRWPASQSPRDQARAVCEAIAARLLGIGDTEVGMRPVLFGARHGLPLREVDFGTRDFHALANLLGDRLRARLDQRERPAKDRRSA